MIALVALFMRPTGSRALTPTAAPAASPTPTDFSKVSEILGGRRLLFPEDDIIVTRGGGVGDAEVFDDVLQTKNNTISGVFPTDISGSTSFVVASGRIFNTPEDEVVTVGSGFVTLEATNFDTRFDNALGTVTQNVYAMADFTGDGLADLAFVTNDEIEMITAADPNNLSSGFFLWVAGRLPDGAVRADRPRGRGLRWKWRQRTGRGRGPE